MRRWGRLRSIATIACVVAPLGCAPIALQPPQGPLDFGFRGGEGRQVRVVSPFTDVRPRAVCAELKDLDHLPGKGKPTNTASVKDPQASLRCSDAPPVWFAERLATALAGAGFRVLDANDPGSGDVIEIRGALRRLEIEEVSARPLTVFFEGDTSIELTVTSPSGLLARRAFYTKASRTSSWRGGMLQSVLDESATRSVREMTAALLTLANRYSTLGMATR